MASMSYERLREGGERRRAGELARGGETGDSSINARVDNQPQHLIIGGDNHQCIKSGHRS